MILKQFFRYFFCLVWLRLAQSRPNPCRYNSSTRDWMDCAFDCIKLRKVILIFMKFYEEKKEFMLRETAVVVKSKPIYFYFLSEICKMELESLATSNKASWWWLSCIVHSTYSCQFCRVSQKTKQFDSWELPMKWRETGGTMNRHDSKSRG